MKRLKVHVLYEFGPDLRPHGSAFLRLIRPLSYPALQQQFDITFGRGLSDLQPDLVLVDRLWNPSQITPVLANKLADEIKSRGGKLLVCFDDNFLDPEVMRKGISSDQVESFLTFLNRSDGLLTTTSELRDSYYQYQSRIVVIPNALDERLIIRKSYQIKNEKQKIVVGYMGTATHEDDLAMVLPALENVSARFPGRIQFQMVGISENDDFLERCLSKLPLEIVRPLPGESDYPFFMVWFTGNVRWDIAISPLVDNSFNKCKSDIKFLDYTAACVPGLFSTSKVYAASIRNRINGLLVGNNSNDWESALEEMILFPKLRAELIHHAEIYLYEERVLRVCYEEWIKSLQEFA